jgi:hypothetical protein
VNPRRKNPAKEDIIEALQALAAKSPKGYVTLPDFEAETGWTKYWFHKLWPTGDYQGACEEAGVKPGPRVGIDIGIPMPDEEVAARFAEATESLGRIPPLKNLIALTRMGEDTVRRGEIYETAKARLIRAYFSLPAERRKPPQVEAVLRTELDRLEGRNSGSATVRATASAAPRSRNVAVPDEYLRLVADLRSEGEEEQRQLIVQFLVEVLEYDRRRVRSEKADSDICVLTRKGEPWLVIEVKPSLRNEPERRAARRQAFDYAHGFGLRYVAISDGDYYEVYDRHAGERMRYNEMRLGSFQLTSLALRDGDLLSLLASGV